MTEELLATAKHNQNFGSDIGTSGSASPSFPQSQKNENVNCHPYMILLFQFSLFLVRFYGESLLYVWLGLDWDSI